jgi:lantibiotic modifying enzyme
MKIQMLSSRARDSVWLEAALDIGRQLFSQGEQAEHGLHWMGDDLTGEDPSQARVVRGDIGGGLYSGSVGVGRFLAFLGQYVGDEQLVQAGISAIASALGAYQRRLSPADLSLYTGATGVALVGVEVAMQLQNEALLTQAVGLATASAQQVSADGMSDALDLIGGSAGVIVALCAIQRRAPHAELVRALQLAAAQLVARRRACVVGCCWPDPHTGSPYGLCGLAHGASGIAWSLYEVAEVTADPTLIPIADDALRYERSWFDPTQSNWPDLRSFSHEPGSVPGGMAAWCHGAIGIGSVRWQRYERTADLSALAEASASIHAARAVVATARRALKQGTLSDATICHGLGGVVELLLLAHEVTGLAEHARAARKVGELCLEIFDANHGEWTVGLPGGRCVPGLMTGVAGIGTFLLRLHDPTAIGSPLLAGRCAPELTA